MAYPFPGMNPWLENPLLWHDVHQSLIIALRDDLSPRLRPRYFVAVETHTYVTLPSTVQSTGRYPDVMVVERGGPALAGPVAVETAPYFTIDLPQHDPLKEGYLEVRLMPNGEVVTVIELLSHANKHPGANREEHIEKRREFIASRVGIVEIDLLRAGPPMPFAERAGNSHYRLFLRQRERPFQARLYPFSVRQPIPQFPLPLLPNDQEPMVDLNALLHGVYERAGYDLVINYAQPPEPPLSDEDAAWAAEVLSPTTT